MYLLTNCVCYAENRVTISVCQQKTQAALTSTSDGELIFEQGVIHLFEQFYKDAGGQMGISMALSLEYVRLHQGNISISVCSGKTIFENVLCSDPVFPVK